MSMNLNRAIVFTLRDQSVGRTPSLRCARQSRCIRCRQMFLFGQGAAMGTPYATAYRAGGWSGKRDVASGDRQRISASRSGRGTSSRHGAGSVGENRASAKEVGRKNEEGGMRKEELKMGRKRENCVSPASTALDHYLASDLPTPNATAWQAT